MISWWRSQLLEQGRYQGVDAVIDKDKTSALLAAHLQSDQLMILTAVDYVYINYGKRQSRTSDVTVDDMKDILPIINLRKAVCCQK